MSTGTRNFSHGNLVGNDDAAAANDVTSGRKAYERPVIIDLGIAGGTLTGPARFTQEVLVYYSPS